MAKIYRKYRDSESVGFVYRRPIWDLYGFWIVLACLSVLLFSLLNWFLPSKVMLFWLILSWLTVAMLLAYGVWWLIRGLAKAKGLGRFITKRILEGNIQQALLDTMTINKQEARPTVAVPDVVVTQSQQRFDVTLEKLPGMRELENLADDISSSFRGRWKDYAVTSHRVSDDKTTFNFLLEPVGLDRTWRPSELKDFVNPSHVLKLQEGLEINLADQPHLAVWGRSGSGKSTLLLSLIAQLFAQGADVQFIDGKAEFSSFKVFDPEEKIASDKSHILALLSDVCDLLTQRQAEVEQGVRERKQMGLRAYDLGMKPVVVVADEVGSVVASMDNKEKKELIGYFTQIAQKGRSVSVFLIMASQSPKAEIIPTEVRGQFATRILLGSASGENQRMAFDGEVATAGHTDKFKGYYMLDGATILPQKFHVPDLHRYGMNKLEVFEQAYHFLKLKGGD